VGCQSHQGKGSYYFLSDAARHQTGYLQVLRNRRHESWEKRHRGWPSRECPPNNFTIVVAVLIGSFHYSTHAFSTYHGGKILLQAATPWLILTAYPVPQIDLVPAAVLVVGAVLFAFFAKLTGLIIVAAALVASSLVGLKFSRRTPRWARHLFLVLCALMALYGVASFSYHELTTAKGQSLDRASWTNQRMFDAAAIDFARILRRS
jgi:hypothetical protein